VFDLPRIADLGCLLSFALLDPYLVLNLVRDDDLGQSVGAFDLLQVFVLNGADLSLVLQIPVDVLFETL
jgi:hypothetical protein